MKKINKKVAGLLESQGCSMVAGLLETSAMQKLQKFQKEFLGPAGGCRWQ